MNEPRIIGFVVYFGSTFIEFDPINSFGSKVAYMIGKHGYFVYIDRYDFIRILIAED